MLAGRRVLVTGDTGFKGSWSTVWLRALGAEVTGLALGVPTVPSMFELLDLGARVRHLDTDVRDVDAVRRAVRAARPEVVLHLAAQPLVSQSYRDPLETLGTNVLGTANLLQALREADRPCAVVLVTSDKCYRNDEWPWRYRESDHLGGADPYSASKAAAEIVAHAFGRAFFGVGSAGSGSPVQLATARAGNVIGGGDWAADRIVPDCVRAWGRQVPVELRHPASTRPWQHVLESLSGYLVLAARLLADVDRGELGALHGESFNFGPGQAEETSVLDVVTGIAAAFGHPDPAGSYRVAATPPFPEAGRLRLDSSKALLRLDWRGVLDRQEMLTMTGAWYRAHAEGPVPDLARITAEQVREYTVLARARGLAWAGAGASPVPSPRPPAGPDTSARRQAAAQAVLQTDPG